MLDCNVVMVSVLLTIKCTAVIKPEINTSRLYVRESVVISLHSYWSVLEAGA